MTKKRIKEGVYLVIDPSMEQPLLFKQLEKALKASISAVQIWDNWAMHVDKGKIIEEIIGLGAKYNVPVLMNNDWTLIKNYPFDGVHFDEVPENFEEIKETLEYESLFNKNFIFGITCNNDMEVIEWAAKKEMDYLSFCSMFPSATSNSCELVSIDSLHKARAISDLPIFLAGGIRPDNMEKFGEVNYQGVALVSGIMGAIDPELAALEYLQQLDKNQR